MFKKVASLPTNGTFTERLDCALGDAGLSNAQFAGRFGPNGHQTVYNWRRRGRAGCESTAGIRAALPGITLDWLNDGVGPMKLPAPWNADAVADAYVALVRRFTSCNLHYDVGMDPDLLVLAVEFITDPNPQRQVRFTSAVTSRVNKRSQRIHGHLAYRRDMAH